MIALPATGADDGPYRVRAIFDNGGFIVKDEEVRIAGARAGTIESVDVSGPDEIVSLEDGGKAIPGKAVVVLEITDDAFKDFREDAYCIIRPASLIGEKYVDCLPTQPRAPGSEPPPELEQIPDGEPGEGQRLLPLENNGKAVDLDLINNINRMPYRDRFRIILNDLGAGLAGRGEDLGEVIDRANPALRQTNRVLAILAQQNRALADLASNGDAVLEPLARNRTSVSGFIRNAAIAGEATAERKADLEEGLRKFPETLREVRLTMAKLKQFTDQGTPLFTDINVAAPHLSKATQKLKPFASLAIPSFKTLGTAAESAGPKLAAADPVIQDLANQTEQLGPASQSLGELLDTFVRSKGAQYLMDFIYTTAGTTNGFDQVGRYIRGNIQVTNCIFVSEIVVQGCEAFYREDTGTTKKKKKKKKKKSKKRNRSRFRGAVATPAPAPAPQPSQPSDSPPIEELIPELDPPDDGEQPPQQSDPAPGAGDGGGDAGAGDDQLTPEERAEAERLGLDPDQLDALSIEEASMLLDYLLGDGR
jgi:ABC-type transporter Mla subunit MlaD